MSAIAFATVLLVFMLSWQFGSYNTMINSTVKIHTGHLQVQAKGYRENRKMHLVLPDPSQVGEILQEIPGVVAYTFRANTFSLVSSEDRTHGVMVAGIDPRREASVSTLDQTVHKGSFLSTKDTNKALIGKLLARNLKVDVGDELVVLGQGRDGSIAATMVEVKGIFSSGQDEFDRSTIHIPIQFFQDVYTMQGAVHKAVVIGESLEDVPRIKTAIKTSLRGLTTNFEPVVLDWKQLMPGLIQAIQMDLVGGLIFYVILIVVVAFSILNTFLMAIFERTREFGVLMAMGTTPGRLTKLLLMESFSMTLLGVASGVILGALVTWYFQIHGIVISGASELMRQFGLPERTFPELSLLSICVGAGIVLVITLLAALYPAFKIRGLSPVEAMA